MGTKPAKHSPVELLTSGIHGTAVTSKRYLPKNYVSRIVSANPFGLLERNVVICQSVYQKNRHATSNHRLLGGGICQVDTTSKPAVQEGQFDSGSQSHPAQPRSRMKNLTHAHVCNLLEAGER